MPTPQFILDLRHHVGTAPLFLNGVAAVIFDDRDEPQRILLGQRADNGQWRLPAGIVEPGEQPAQALVREVLEETGVRVAIDRLVELRTLPMITYPNGDQVQYLSCVFRAHHLAGDPHVADDESLAVGWYRLDQLPDSMPAGDHESIKLGLPLHGMPYFEC